MVFSSVQLLHRVWLLVTPWTVAHQAFLYITNSWSLLKLTPIESVMASHHLTSVVPFSSHLQSFPTSASFLMSQFFTSGGQSIGASASASVLPMNIQGWFPLGFTGLISLLSKGTLNHHLQHHTLKPLIHQCLAFVMVQLSHPLHHYWKNHSFDYMDLCCKVMSLLFNTLSRSVIAFLPRSKHLLILHGIAKQNSKKWNISEIFYFPHLLPKKSFPQSMGFSRQEC